MRKYKTVLAAGTFDLLHEGHKAFLRHALLLGEVIVLGVTTDAFAKKKHHDTEPFIHRKKALLDFFKQEKVSNQVTIVPIDSVHIPQAWEEHSFDILLVTEDSKKGAEIVNKKRATDGREPLRVEVFPLLQAEEGVISSTRIRNGEVGRDGRVWVQSQWKARDRVLPPLLRQQLKRPFGEIVDSKVIKLSEEEQARLVAVGDITTKTLCERSIFPRLSVVDFLVERKKTFSSLQELFLPPGTRSTAVTSKPGSLSGQLFQAVLHFFRDMPKEPHALQINGEEDLSVLPLILAAPLSWVILYGQPGLGTVRTTVTEQTKKKAYDLVEEFTEELARN